MRQCPSCDSGGSVVWRWQSAMGWLVHGRAAGAVQGPTDRGELDCQGDQLGGSWRSWFRLSWSGLDPGEASLWVTDRSKGLAEGREPTLARRPGVCSHRVGARAHHTSGSRGPQRPLSWRSGSWRSWLWRNDYFPTRAGCFFGYWAYLQSTTHR